MGPCLPLKAPVGGAAFVGWWLVGVVLCLLALVWPEGLYGSVGLGDPRRFTQERFQRSARWSRRLVRGASAALGVAFLLRALSPRLPPEVALWLQVGFFCLGWALLLAVLGVTLWFMRV